VSDDAPVLGVVRNVIRNWVIPGIVLLLLVSAVQAFFNSKVGVADGEPAPDFALVDTEGLEVSLQSLAGKHVVINFWGTWCPPCIEELPGLSRFARAHPEVVVLGIAIDSGEGKVLAAAKQRLDIQFQVLAADNLVQGAYGVRVLPTTFLVDPQGVVQRHQVGVVSPERLNSWLR